MKNKHSPGPWKLGEFVNVCLKDDDTPAYIQDSSGDVIADCYPDDNPVKPHAERQANAKLITAAPDLLEACEKINEALIKQGFGNSRIPEFNLLWAAIAKARGEAND